MTYPLRASKDSRTLPRAEGHHTQTLEACVVDVYLTLPYLSGGALPLALPLRRELLASSRLAEAAARPRGGPGAALASALSGASPDGARERDDVADVSHRRRVEHEALEANAEARVRLRAEAARVEVGRVVLLLKP
eukprot:CAMPEP_0185373622 /NCGR_PEP_ID=MMETSP1364-20130426/29470_1 /TAXON_ID=38817 /ORGANISM="Gephyrocapsa oceanica, Strain RCC1303" /LENGTH=135 /DNA_ID=CAMNT_0027974713 /DNA_START=46 /DNA_END=451 /DNA_ORIENTATION=+